MERFRRRLLPFLASVMLLAALNAHSAHTAHAQERLRLADLVAEARAQNPDLAAAAARTRAAAAVPARVSALDDPVLSWEAWNFPESFRIDEADNNIFRVSQKLPFFGKRALAAEVATRDTAVTAAEAHGTELDVVAAVTKAYYDLWRAHRLIAVYTREKDLVQRIARIAEQKYGTSQVSQADVLRAEVELSHLLNRLQTATLGVKGAEADLRAALGRQTLEPFGVPEDPPPARLPMTVEEATTLALAERPEIATRRAAIARDEAGVRQAERARLPDFEVAFARFQNAHASDGFGAMASITLPIAQPGKYAAGVEEANARLSAEKAALRRTEDDVRREVAQAFVRAETARAQHDLFASAHVPHAEQAFAVTESAYQTGAVDFMSLVDSLRQIEMVHTEHVEAQAEFERAYADLERAVGKELPRPTEPAPKGGHHHG
jgi:outer membrane protein TolC